MLTDKGTSEYGRTHLTGEGSFDIHNGKTDSGHQSMNSNSSNRGVEVIEQFEHGVYVTLLQNPDGTKEFKRVRFRYPVGNAILFAYAFTFHIILK